MPGGAPVLSLDADAGSPGFGTVMVTGLERATRERLRGEERGFEEWVALFAVYTGETLPAEGEGEAVWGSYAVEDAAVRFTPRFPLVPGQPYTARWAGEPPLETRFALPAPDVVPSTLVSAIYPSADELPENLLKLYVTFSAPMRRGEAHRHLRLLDEAGEEIPEPFVAPEHELWDPDTTRLTIFLDPGRIKREVGPNLEMGPPLVEGGSYRLVVSADWPDAAGAPLASGFEKAFRVTAADRTSPDVGHWRLQAPAGGLEPLAVRFAEPLDAGLLQRVLTVVNPAGAAVAGEVELSEGETRWIFEPAAPWAPGRYALRVGTALEDLAGNSLLRPFETPVGAAEEGQDSLEIEFEVGPLER